VKSDENEEEDEEDVGMSGNGLNEMPARLNRACDDEGGRGLNGLVLPGCWSGCWSGWSGCWSGWF
jgi:hypothetical protein